MIVLDTHAWVWWIGDPRRLSQAAHQSIDEASKQDGIYVSSMSTWEVAMLVKKGRLQLTMNVADWIAQSALLPSLHFVPVDNSLALRSVHLPDSLSPDPVDRIIVATAIKLDAPLVTKDKRIRASDVVATIW